MARRADPERICQARRDAIRNTLTGSGMPPEMAERWSVAWEIEAAGAEWIAVERATMRPGW